ncbi:hypothetical protein [Streptomyces sp. NPDC001221]
MMEHEAADDFPDYSEDIGVPLSRPRPGVHLSLVPDPQPSEAELAAREVEAELAAVIARGPVIAATVDGLRRAVERLVAELREDER